MVHIFLPKRVARIYVDAETIHAAFIVAAKIMRVCRNAKLRHTLFSWVRMCKMQGAEIKDEGSVRKYMTKSEIDEQRSSLHIMTQRHNIYQLSPFTSQSCRGRLRWCRIAPTPMPGRLTEIVRVRVWSVFSRTDSLKPPGV